MRASVSFRRPPRMLGVQPRLQENDRRDLVDHLAAARPAHITRNEESLGLDRGEPLVPLEDRQAGGAADLFDDRPGQAGASSPPAVHIQGKTDHDAAYVMIADEGSEPIEVRGPGGARQGHEWPGRETQFVAEGDTDPPVPVIEGQRAPRTAASLRVSGRGVAHGRKVYAAPGEVKERGSRVRQRPVVAPSQWMTLGTYSAGA